MKMQINIKSRQECKCNGTKLEEIDIEKYLKNYDLKPNFLFAYKQLNE